MAVVRLRASLNLARKTRLTWNNELGWCNGAFD
jgi:hypothetical protein